DNFVIFYSSNPADISNDYIEQVSKNKMICPACQEESGKKAKIKLGVSERINVISTYEEPQHPEHRPPYINAIPLIDIIRSVKKIKSVNSKTVLKQYNAIISELGPEFKVLIDTPIKEIENFDKEISSVINAFRNNEIEYTPGGGGTYGQIKIDLENE
ncbi:MAG TPA: hypothetical protein VGB37_02955, partial [Candidatus Lokiarchaeia archaeon]